MKKITKILFFVSMITAIITIVCSIMWSTLTIKAFQGEFNDLYIDSPDETDTVSTSGNIFVGLMNFLVGAPTFLILLMFLVILIPVIFIPIFYLVSWLIHINKDTRKNTIASIVLTIIALLINSIITYIITKTFILFITLNTSFLLLLAILSNLFCIITSIVYGICKKEEIKVLLAKPLPTSK